eukprot:Lithocolla_globosa_v1_NODE_24_length_9285_cov_66.491832.p5 type:complete len:206 gc:universal NODE_24_length_9285_cov_66.491832:5939-6556(+)
MELKFDHRSQYVGTSTVFGKIGWYSDDTGYEGEVCSIRANNNVSYNPAPSIEFYTRINSASQSDVPVVNMILQNDGMLRTNSILPLSDNSKDLGSSSRRWDDIFATNGIIQTSDQNQKDNIKDSDLGLEFILKMKPKSYKWKGKTRQHYSLLAQDVKIALDGKEFGGYIEHEYYVDDMVKMLMKKSISQKSRRKHSVFVIMNSFP